MTTKLTIRPHEIEGLLDRAPAGIGTLSLDCFDTLIWRNTHCPRDVFTGIALDGGAVEPRVWSEDVARRMTYNRTGCYEIGLADVYRRLHPRADEDAVAAHVAHELALEASHAFAFAPVVALIGEAKRRGLGVVIVSDMYLNEAQLRAHITSAAGPEVMAMIDHVFVSADHGVSKGNGLFDVVCKRLGVAPGTILHVGDNRHADHDSASAYGLHGVHMRQFDAETETRLRHEAVAATMIDPRVGLTRAPHQQYRAQAALRTEDDTAYVLGHDVMGPAFHTFALWLKAEIDDLSARLGKPVRPLFMMRDGYLPMQVFDTMFPDAGAMPVEISRFVAIRASIHDKKSLEDYVDEWIDGLPLKALARQLMLYDHEIKAFIKDGDGARACKAFERAMRKPDMQRRILSRTRAFGDRLLAHLRRAGVAEGDAVMLVDIGYNGSVQNILDPVLTQRMGLTVAGRYMFLREGQLFGIDKRGLLDVRRFEARVLHAMSTCVAVIEQLCNVSQGSTTGFTADGEPIREERDLKAAHNATRDRVQAACMDFVRNAGRGVVRAPASDTLEARIDAAGATMARLFFMPNTREVELFETFNHDINLGSDMTVKLFDAEDASAGMRHRGLTYVNEKRRTYVPGEIQRKGLPLTLSLFASARFGLDLRSTDFNVGGIDIPVVLLGRHDEGVVDMKAYPTVEGFYRLLVPVGDGRFTPGVQLGHVCEWVQIEATTWARASAADLAGGTDPFAAVFVADAMERLGDDLYRCGPTGLIMVPPPATTEAMVLSVVFRPVQWRKAAAAGVARAA